METVLASCFDCLSCRGFYPSSDSQFPGRRTRQTLRLWPTARKRCPRSRRRAGLKKHHKLEIPFHKTLPNTSLTLDHITEGLRVILHARVLDFERLIYLPEKAASVRVPEKVGEVAVVPLKWNYFISTHNSFTRYLNYRSKELLRQIDIYEHDA